MRFLITIPVYNEDRHIQRVLPLVLKHALDVLVVDDGSTDRTPEILRAFPSVRVLRHAENRGYGQSLISAFRYAQRRGYDWVITLDCDEQHDPALIDDFLERMRADEADIISGSRYLDERLSHDSPPADRRRINMTCNAMLEQVLGLRLTDSFCGFKAYRVDALRRLRLTETGYAFPLQFWVQCVRAGLRIEELPVTRVYRDLNRSFGVALDDPAARMRHYLEVFVNALREAQPETLSTSRGSRKRGQLRFGTSEAAREARSLETLIGNGTPTGVLDAAVLDGCCACRLPA